MKLLVDRVFDSRLNLAARLIIAGFFISLVILARGAIQDIFISTAPMAAQYIITIAGIILGIIVLCFMYAILACLIEGIRWIFTGKYDNETALIPWTLASLRFLGLFIFGNWDRLWFLHSKPLTDEEKQRAQLYDEALVIRPIPYSGPAKYLRWFILRLPIKKVVHIRYESDWNYFQIVVQLENDMYVTFQFLYKQLFSNVYAFAENNEYKSSKIISGTSWLGFKTKFMRTLYNYAVRK